mmetsp:Transcript_65338/g.116479  ORF Transcript_65338/g.116479 Transcript_65338/m.116479 type:complete len:427 (-) Transcript_65338:229-1509(-)
MPIDLDSVDSNRDERMRGMDLFFVAAEGSVEQAKILLDARVDPNFRDYEQRCPLHVAAGFGNIPMMKLLVERGADVNATDRWGFTPVYQCEQGKHSKAARMLKGNGAKLQRIELQQQAQREKWEVRRSEVHIGQELSRTLKSSVHRATWNGIDVVAKFILDEDAGVSSEELEHELLHEIALLATVRHPDLVMFLGCCLQESPMMFITEFMPEGDLERYYGSKAKEKGRAWAPGPKTVSRWARSILRALHFLHHCSEPIVHRDLKPLNILLTATLDAKVSDFGISRTMYRGTPDKDYWKPKAAPVTTANSDKMTAGVGSWRYMAPEVARGEGYTEKVDVYAWALILYFMGSGLQPFHEYADAKHVLDEYSKGNEPRPNSSECPACFRLSMEAAWHILPEKRPSAAELGERLVEDRGQGQCATGCTSM